MSVSLHEYHLRVRLRRALAMLRQSNVTVDAVASMNGYATTEAFHRAFRRVTGLTPHEARLLTPEGAVTVARTRLALEAELGHAPRGA